MNILILFNEAIGQTFGWCALDPLIFDLDGDGKISLTDSQNGINFDIDCNGMAQKTSWVTSGDGLLVRDINENEKIDNGSELFGDYTTLPDGTLAKYGMQALAALDSNKDGLISASDELFPSLKFLKAA